MVSQKSLKVFIVKTKMPTGGPSVGLYLPLGKSFIYHSFSFSAFAAQMGNLEPLGTNEKMKAIVAIIALVP